MKIHFHGAAGDVTIFAIGEMTQPATIVRIPIQRRSVTRSPRKNCPIRAIAT